MKKRHTVTRHLGNRKSMAESTSMFLAPKWSFISAKPRQIFVKSRYCYSLQSLLPSDDSLGEEFIYQLEIVLLQVLNLGHIVRLGVKIIRVECLDGSQHLFIFFVHHPAVFVVAPADHYIVESTAGSVDAVLSAVDGIFAVRVVGKSAWVNDALVEFAAHDKGVADDIPLTLCVEEEEQFAQIVDQTCVKSLHSLPDAHLGTSLAVETVTGSQIVSNRLLLMLLSVEILDAVTGVFVVAELRLVLFGVEFGGFVNVLFFLGGGAILYFQSGFEDVDVVDVVGGCLKGETVFVVVEVLGNIGFLDAPQPPVTSPEIPGRVEGKTEFRKQTRDGLRGSHRVASVSPWNNG
ncbi:DUF706-domain-containing protein, partial [Aureobasidium sp. EXF-3399]